MNGFGFLDGSIQRIQGGAAAAAKSFKFQTEKSVKQQLCSTQIGIHNDGGSAGIRSLQEQRRTK